MSLVLAAAFGTFLTFVVLGLGALAVTAALDRLLGKERALLLYALALLAFTALVLKDKAVDPGEAKPKPETALQRVVGKRVLAPNLLARPAFEAPGAGDERRNVFERTTDTRPLPPIEIELPPEIALEFPLPPTVPGLAPQARRPLRGAAPTLSASDTSIPLDVAPIVFDEYVLTPEDSYDWVDAQGKTVFVAIVAINGVRRGEEGYRQLERQLAGGEGSDKLQVEWSLIGSSEQAAKGGLDAISVAKRSKGSRTTSEGSRFPQWSLRRSVENVYDLSVRMELGSEPVATTKNLRGLLKVAEDMAKVGATGKEDREGWRRAVLLLERALAVAQQTSGLDVQADVLVRLVEAYQALKDEQSALRALTAYAKAAPTRSQPWVKLGRLALEGLGLPEQALIYFATARELEPTSPEVALGEGDAYTLQARDRDALAAYTRAGASFEAQVGRAEAALRLGDLAQARQASDAALNLKNDHPRALLARGAILYSRGELAGAKGAFAMAATSSAESGVWRAQALYNLGLTCWRLAETRAAVGAFAACEAALHMGASPSRRDDETVSPSLGRALVAMALAAPTPVDPAAPAAATGDGTAPEAAPLDVTRGAVGEYLSAARDEAGRNSYLEHLAGVLATNQGNTEAAIRSLRRALALAPEATELDSWLALNHLRWGAATAGRAAGVEAIEVPAGADEAARVEASLARPSAQQYEAAVAFAARAAAGDGVDAKMFRSTLRETWVRLQAEHLSPRRRFEAAREAADRILKRSENRDLLEQPAALCMRAYANYRLGGDEQYDACQQDLLLVLGKVKPDEPSEWLPWREYAAKTLEKVKHWRSLEEKVVSFEGLSELTKDWIKAESGGILLNIDSGTGVLGFKGKAGRDGTLAEPLVAAVCQTLFDKATFVEARLKLRIPTANADGSRANNVFFGVAVQGATSPAGAGVGGVTARHPGISLFFEKGLVAARVGSGTLMAAFKDGDVHRVHDEAGKERPWPAGEWVDVRIVREDAKEGLMAIYLGNDPLPAVSDKISGFKGVSGKAELWIGGWSPMTTPFDMQVKDIRIVRIRK